MSQTYKQLISEKKYRLNNLLDEYLYLAKYTKLDDLMLVAITNCRFILPINGTNLIICHKVL